MAVISPGDAFAPVEVARGVVVEERVQQAGGCEQADSSQHAIILQSVPVTRAQQRWEGTSREGAMSAGEVAVLPAGLPMRWQWDGAVQSLHVSIDDSRADALAAELMGGPTVELAPSFVIDDAPSRHLLQTLRMEAAIPTDSLRCEHVVQLLLTRLGSRRRTSVRPPRGTLPADRVNAVMEWVEDNLEHRVSVTDMAAIAGVEASWFSRLFTGAVGRPPYRYVLERRVLHAQHAIRAGGSLASVANRFGFVDQAHLTRHFKDIVGHTPGIWAQRARRPA
jgi:AraC family transcriptional regulator